MSWLAVEFYKRSNSDLCIFSVYEFITHNLRFSYDAHEH
jgi:hypothetical protein